MATPTTAPGQTGTGQTAHTKNFILPWATGTTLAAAVATELTARGEGGTWATLFGPNLTTPRTRMVLVRFWTAATDGTFGDGTGTSTIAMTQNQMYGPFTAEDLSTYKYTGSSSARAIIEC